MMEALHEVCGSSVTVVPDCPGLFCGRVINTTMNSSVTCYSSCGPCPDGFRVGNESSLCVPCDDEATVRDYLYLVFMCLVALVLRLALTTIVSWEQLKTFTILLLYGVAVLENTVALILTLLVLHPQGQLSFNACSVSSINDFFPLFFNPTVDFVNEINCVYEAAYPLYRMVFIFLGFSFVFHMPMLTVNLIWSYKAGDSYHGRWFPPPRPQVEYLWLICYPVLVIAHSILAGVIYFIFDFFTVAVSVGAFAVLTTIIHLFNFEDFKNPFKVYKLPVQWALVMASSVLFACGILALTDWGDNISLRAAFIPLVLLPPILHPILTHFASPQAYYQSWRIDNYNTFYDY